MKTLLTSAILALFTFMALPSQAQLAYTRVVLPEDVLLSSNIGTATVKGETGKGVYGVVQGSSGVLPGATVWLSGSKTVAVANSEGVFELPVPQNVSEVEVTCSYAGLQEEVLTLPVDEPGNTVYMLRKETPKGQHFASEYSLKARGEQLLKKVRGK